MSFPVHRLRRLRRTEGLRRLVREAHVRPEQLIMPFFVCSGNDIRRPVPSLPDIQLRSVDRVAPEAKALATLGVGAVLVFGIPSEKEDSGAGAFDSRGIIQEGIRAVKDAAPDLTVVSDVCLSQFTTHGHSGVLEDARDGRGARVDNDATLSVLGKIAASHASAGADLVLASAMMDGQVAAIRKALDEGGCPDTGIIACSTKHASSMYVPFRKAADSAPRFGDRTAYQLDPANADEAMREVAADLDEGADVVMVKPGITSLDLIHRIRAEFLAPVAAYQVSGEYAMVKAAAEAGWLDEPSVMQEMLLALRRAGADCVVTYWAKTFAEMWT